MVTDEQKAAVETAVNEGLIEQRGSHYYAEVDGEEVHVGQGTDAAYDFLAEMDAVPEPGADDGKGSDTEDGDETPGIDLDATYRHEGDSVLRFSRPEREDGMIWPGQNVRYDARNVPLDQSPELRQAIQNGILRPLPQ